MPEQQTRLLAGRYELIAPLGRGTMGTVWRARDRTLGREVAVKEIRQDPGLTGEQRTELRERMVREGRIASRINHPSVAAIHDVMIEGDSPWIIMELIEARSLEQVIEEEGPLPPRLVAEIGVDLLGALRAAHAQGITHRDVKPANVLITENGRVVLTDFGIAKAEGDSRLTRTGMVIGSPGYTAPERARGEYTGPESDIWSLGATLYFAVEGRPAYERATIAETLAALLSENADPPTQAGQLRPVLTGLLNKDYRQRLSAAQAETMLRMVADTPTTDMPALTAEALSAQEAAVPDASAAPTNPSGPGPQPGSGPQGAPQAPSGVPGAPGPAAPYPNAPHAFAPQAPSPYGSQEHGPGFPGGPQAGSPVPAAGAFGVPPAQAFGTGAPAAGAFAADAPPASAPAPAPAGEDFDPDRTISVARPRAFRPDQGAPPRPAEDESAIATTRVPTPRPQNSPGQQVYPVPPGQQRPGPQQPPAPPRPAGPPQAMPPQQQPQQQQQPREGQGLGTELFAIAGGPDQRPSGNRNGMLVLMAVAAAAAVVIAVLIVALLSS
ncbi:serine/threonine-protein kinase [Nonomuraea pusilla]|uniref:non-specific serine/threonine protein kinase n=1 Tax=Nonomuraea pusilla TaxID=46177 RepID=A0A1H7GQS5_9ACTN|nr:serine/threonine-protein kinase [Nonomuraea pusilla]SEK40399.1 Serine/threonine protein kinase [Nonomuraea pusilla]